MIIMAKRLRRTLKKTEKVFVIKTEAVLAATGIRPNARKGLGSAKSRMQAGTKRDILRWTTHMRTNVPGVYAIGDITGKCALAHAASAQGVAGGRVYLCGR